MTALAVRVIRTPDTAHLTRSSIKLITILLFAIEMHLAYAPIMLASTTLVSALGINCRGSSNCPLNTGADLSTLQCAVNSVSDGNTYSDGRT